MENKDKDSISFSDARRTVNQKVSTAIFSILEEKGCSDRTLSTIVEEQYGVSINSGEISKYRHHSDSTNIPTMVIAAFCKRYSLSLEELLHYGDPEQTKQTDQVEPVEQTKQTPEIGPAKKPVPMSLNLYIPGGEELVSSAQSKCFNGYWGTYFTYFMPTHSSETGFL